MINSCHKSDYWVQISVDLYQLFVNWCALPTIWEANSLTIYQLSITVVTAVWISFRHICIVGKHWFNRALVLTYKTQKERTSQSQTPTPTKNTFLFKNLYRQQTTRSQAEACGKSAAHIRCSVWCPSLMILKSFICMWGSFLKVDRTVAGVCVETCQTSWRTCPSFPFSGKVTWEQWGFSSPTNSLQPDDRGHMSLHPPRPPMTRIK